MNSKLESIDSHLRPRSIDHESVELISSPESLVKKFFNEKIDYSIFHEHGRDYSQEVKNSVLTKRLFVQNEVDIVCGFSKDYLSKKLDGHKEDILVGKWKPYRDSGLYVRFNSHAVGGICLSSESESFDSWTFEYRGDCRENRGFFHSRNISYPNMKRALFLSEKFIESLEGYSKVASARNPKTRPNI